MQWANSTEITLLLLEVLSLSLRVERRLALLEVLLLAEGMLFRHPRSLIHSSS
jgi:hypothetical protein